MFYVMGQVLVCMVLTAMIGLLAGWLARGYNARAEVAAVKRRAQLQARDLRNRATNAQRAAERTREPEDAAPGQPEQELRAELDRLKSLVNQREKEIAQLRRVLGEQRSRANKKPPPSGRSGAPGQGQGRSKR